MSFIGLHGDQKFSGQLIRVIIGSDLRGQLSFFDQYLVQWRFLAFRHNFCQVGQGIGILVVLFNHGPNHGDLRHVGKVVLMIDAPGGIECDIHGLPRRYFAPFTDLPKIFAYQRFCGIRIKVAGQYQGGIIRTVEFVIKGFNIRRSGIPEVFHLTDNLPAVRMIRRKNVFVNDIIPVSIGLVIHTLPFLILNHILLDGKCFLGNRIYEISHPVGFHPQNQLQRISGNHFKIGGDIIGGKTVQRTTDILYLPEELILRDIFRFLEQHMLKKVCKPCSSFLFTA